MKRAQGNHQLCKKNPEAIQSHLKVIPQCCIAYPVLRTTSPISHCDKRAHIDFLANFTVSQSKDDGYLLLNEHGDLSFFLHNSDVQIISFKVKNSKAISRKAKEIHVNLNKAVS